MSRIAKSPVLIPNGVEVVVKQQDIEVKGPKGTLTHQFPVAVAVACEEEDGAKVVKFSPRDHSKVTNALAGTTRALVNNMVTGVSQGFERSLILKGVGYREQVQGNKLNLTLGFSHPVAYELPQGVTAETPNQTTIVVKGNDKQKVGQAAAEIRSFRPPEPYKGKGIRYSDEIIIRKETKKK